MPSRCGQVTAEDGKFVEAADGDSYTRGAEVLEEVEGQREVGKGRNPVETLTGGVAGVWRTCVALVWRLQGIPLA